MVTTGVEHVVEALGRRREELLAEVIDHSRAVPGYSALAPGQAADFADTVREGLNAVVRAMRAQRPLAERDVEFLWAHVRRRTEAGVPEGDMLAVVRIFQRVLWDAILDLAEDDDEGRDAALVLARPLLSYVDVLSHTVDAAYAEADEARSVRAGAVRRQALDALLAGTLPSPGSALDAARRSGLDHDRPFLVLSARAASDKVDEAALGVGCLSLARCLSGTVEPLAAVREDEIVIATVADAATLVDDVRATQTRLDRRGVRLAVGLSTVRTDLTGTRAAYREACLAREQVRAGGVLALGELTVADYLILGAGDDTAWRLVPAAVRRFVEEDASGGRVLSDTLLAYLDCDLNVRLAAERLFVHPNTAHYRLARVEERTGCSVRRLRDVLLIAIAIRLHRRTLHRRT
jgi:hypothetical protein